VCINRNVDQPALSPSKVAWLRSVLDEDGMVRVRVKG